MLVANSYVGTWLGQSWACRSFPVGHLSSYAPGSLTRRSHGVTPSSVAPECLGTRTVAQGLEYIHLSFIDMHGSSVGRWQSGGHDKTCFEGCSAERAQGFDGLSLGELN